MAASLALFFLPSCSFFDFLTGSSPSDGGDDQTSSRSSEDDMASVFSSWPDSITESVISESGVTENIEEEKELYEKAIDEYIYKEATSSEAIINENISLESFSTETFYNVTDAEIAQLSCEASVIDPYDYEEIKANIKEGMNIVITECIYDLSTISISLCLAFVTSGASLQTIPTDLTEMGLMIGGSAIGAFIGGLLRRSLSVKAGNNDKTVFYDTVSGAAKGFVVGAKIIDAFLFVEHAIDFIKLCTSVYKSISNNLRHITVGTDGSYISGKSYNEAQTDGTFKKYKVNKFGDIVDANGVYYKSIKDFQDLQNADSATLYQKLIHAGDYMASSGEPTYNVQDIDGKHFIQKWTADADGTFTLKGAKEQITDDGWILKPDANGNLKKCLLIDPTSTGAPKADLHKLLNAGLSYDDDFMVTNATRTVDGIEYFKGGDADIAYKKGNYIFDAKKSTVIGQFSDDGDLLVDWQNNLNYARLKGTKEYRSVAAKLIQNYPESWSYFSNEFTVDQLKYVKSTGRMPDAFQIHHIKSVAMNPDYAGDISKMQVLSRADHLRLGHGGSFQNPAKATSTYFDIVALCKALGVVI